MPGALAAKGGGEERIDLLVVNQTELFQSRNFDGLIGEFADGEELVDRVQDADVILFGDFVVAEIAPRGGLIAGDEGTGGAEVDSRVGANQACVAQEPDEHSGAAQTGPGMSGDVCPGRTGEQDGTHEQGGVRRDVGPASQINAQARGFFGEHGFHLTGFVGEAAV